MWKNCHYLKFCTKTESAGSPPVKIFSTLGAKTAFYKMFRASHRPFKRVNPKNTYQRQLCRPGIPLAWLIALINGPRRTLISLLLIFSPKMAFDHAEISLTLKSRQARTSPLSLIEQEGVSGTTKMANFIRNDWEHALQLNNWDNSIGIIIIPRMFRILII